MQRSHFAYSRLSHRALPGLVEARGARRARPKEFLPRQTHGKNELDFFCFANSARRCDAGADIIRPRRGGSISCRSPANSHRVFLLSRRLTIKSQAETANRQERKKGCKRVSVLQGTLSRWREKLYGQIHLAGRLQGKDQANQLLRSMRDGNIVVFALSQFFG